MGAAGLGSLTSASETVSTLGANNSADISSGRSWALSLTEDASATFAETVLFCPGNTPPEPLSLVANDSPA